MDMFLERLGTFTWAISHNIPRKLRSYPRFQMKKLRAGQGFQRLKAISTENGGTRIWGQLASLLYLQRQPSGM